MPSIVIHRLSVALALACLIGVGSAAAVPDTLAQRALACTGCHAVEDRAGPEGVVPHIAGKGAGYLFEQMRNFRDGRRVHETMALLMENLDDRYLRELAAYFSDQQPSRRYRPTAALTPAAAQRAEGLIRQGDRAGGIPACSACHGASLTGSAPNVPGLLGLPAAYLAEQLGAWRVGLRHARAPDCMARVARGLAAEDIAVIAQWLQSRPVPLLAAPAAPPPSWPLACGSVAPTGAAPAAAAAAAAAQVARGRLLALQGNCAGCHTAAGGRDYAGGPAIATPFGLAYAGNLTPDDGQGLGRWSADDFWRALHEGRSRDGRVLLPVFPYTSYTHVTRADSDALYAYLRSLPPVAQANRPQEIRFPYRTQFALTIWQWLYFRPADPAVDEAGRRRLTPAQARGAYLVQGLGHCGACHAPRGALGQAADEVSGGTIPIQGWFAPSLHPGAGHAASSEDIVALLKTGQSAGSAVLGPMAGVVFRSTQHWPDEDLRAVAAYLATLPAAAAGKAPTPAAPAVLKAGSAIYADRCADCHGRRGEGVPGIYPALAGSPTVLHPTARNLVQLLRHGGFPPSTAGNARPYGMPPQSLGAADTAALSSFLRQSWGNRASAVSEFDVLMLR
ncbi:MAG: cytochrome c [Burkholderiales bacterium]|nr:cytochrome c [Burkholderiales bacterium]